MGPGIRLAALAFALTWVPLTVWRGLALGRSFRIGSQGQDHAAPLVDAIIQVAFAMLAPALFAALATFVFWAWREERRATKR